MTYSDKAMKIVLEEFDLDIKQVESFDESTQTKIVKAAIQVEEELQYNKLKWMKLYEYQKEFCNAGSEYARRAFLAANRSGKTIATAYEVAVHSTGLYPTWWKGLVMPSSPSIYVLGESWPQVAAVTQKELLGTDNVSLISDVGIGMIPKHLIDLEAMQKDGPNCRSFRVKHKSGGWSNIYFKNYNQSDKDLQGFKADLIVFDEQPPDNIWDEMMVRTTIPNVDIPVGHAICSFTPLKGKTGVVGKFWSGTDGYYYKRVTIDDVPEYDHYGEPMMTEAAKTELVNSITDPLEIEPRLYGIPKAGAGQAFPWGVQESKYTGSSIPVKDTWLRNIAIDPAKTMDKTVLSWQAYDETNDKIYVYRQEVFRNRVLPEDYIHLLLEEGNRELPVVWPADSLQEGRYTNDGTSLYETLANYGVNVQREPFKNPKDANGNQNNRKNPGINHINWRLKNHKLKIEESNTDLLYELEIGEWSEKNIDKYVGPDDCIDAMRYGVMSLIQGIGSYSSSNSYTYKQNKFKSLRNDLKRKRRIRYGH